jgi:molybdate transport system regulatory protein
MSKRAKEPAAMRLCPRFRLLCGEEVALGPGKVQLLKLVQETGSIRQAAMRMEMSYMRAWSLIRTMNRCFKEPLIEAVRGGSTHGGARPTSTGIAAIRLYDRLVNDSLAATQQTRRQFAALLKRNNS